MQMEARAPIAGPALRATRDLPDAPQCPPSGGRHSKGRSPSPCTKMEQSYPLHRHRSERAGSRVRQCHTPETVEVRARRTGERDGPVPIAENLETFLSRQW